MQRPWYNQDNRKMKLEDIHYQISRFTKELQKLGQSGLGEEHKQFFGTDTNICRNLFYDKSANEIQWEKGFFFPINVLEPLDIRFFHMNVESTSPNTPKFIQDISRFQMQKVKQ